MRNLSHYPDDPFVFYQDVVSKKKYSAKNPLLKTRLALLEANIQSDFHDYTSQFDHDRLQDLRARTLTSQEEEDLLSLYSYRSSTLAALKAKLTTVEFNRIVSTCQYCTIGEVGSFDHIVPKTEFPNFAVHPRNLFPCCTICNGHKSVAWRLNNERLFLNLYLDHLPTVQYLFVDLAISGNTIATTFRVNNSNSIDAALFAKIEHHYRVLHLCSRFSENIDEVVTSLTSDVAGYLHVLPVAQIQDIVLQSCVNEKRMHGTNFWKVILKEALIMHRPFLDLCETEYQRRQAYVAVPVVP